MSNETLLYICGIVLAVSAVTVSLTGLKVRGFPGKMMPLVVLWFAIFVVGATTFAVEHAKDEDAAKAAEFKEAGEKAEEEGGNVAPEGTEGAINGDEEQAEEEVEGGEGHPEEGKEGAGPEESPESAEEGAEEEGKEGAGEKAEGAGGAEEKGEGGGGAAAAGGGSLGLKASKTELAFDTTKLEAKAGKVTIDLENPSAIPHNVAIEKEGEVIAESATLAEGKTSASAELEPGTYTFLCTVPGHAEAGMEGTLTVK